MAGKKPTIDAIARRCGVARATVSKVLGPSAARYQLGAGTRELVERTAAELGYRARRRRGGPGLRGIGLVFAGDLPLILGQTHFLLTQCARAVRERGFHLTLAPVDGTLAEWLLARGNALLDGLLLTLPLPAGIEAVPARHLPPTVGINTGPLAGLPEVAPDDRQGARDLALHLLGLGHRRVALIGVSGRKPVHACLEIRRNALAAALGGADGTLLDWIDRAPAAVVEGVRGAGAPTALVCYQSYDAPPFWHALTVAGVRIPADLSLVCGDDLPANADMVPALTGLAFDHAAIALTAVDQLTAAISGQAVAAGALIPARLIVRASSGPAPRRGFSLIELLVVIAIVAVLAGLAMTATTLVRDAARTTQCRTALRQIHLASEGYAQDWDGSLVPCMTAAAVWYGRLYPYLDADQVQQGTGGVSGSISDIALRRQGSAIWGCPEWQGVRFASGTLNDTKSGFGMVDQPLLPVQSDTTVDRPGTLAGWGTQRRIPLSAIGQHSARMLAVDSVDWHTRTWNPSWWASRTTDQATATQFLGGARHRGKRANLVFFDGHAAFLTPAECDRARTNPAAGS